MELGALICKPTNPNCNECPLAHNCKAFKNKNFDLVKVEKQLRRYKRKLKGHHKSRMGNSSRRFNWTIYGSHK